MIKTLKYSAFVVFLIVLILLITPFFIPKHVYIDFITDRLEKEYPVKLELKDASLRFLPTPQIALDDISVKVIADKDSLAPLITAKEIKVSPNLLGLLEKDFVPRSIIINNMTVEPEPDKKETKRYVMKYVKITQLKLDSNSLQSKIESKINLPQIEGKNADLVSYLKYNFAANKLFIDASTLGIEKIQLQTKGTIDFSKEEPMIDLSGTTSAINISQLVKETEGSAEVAYNAKGTLPNLKGDITAKVKDVSYQNDSLKVRGQPLEVTSKWALATDLLTISQGTLKLGPQIVQFDGVYPLAELPFNLNINIDKINSKYLKTLFKDAQSIPDMTDANLKLSYSSAGTVKGNFSSRVLKTEEDTYKNLKTDFIYKKDKVHFSNIKAELYEGALSGTATVPVPLQQGKNVAFDISLENASLKKIESLRNQFKGRASVDLKGECNPLHRDWIKTLNANGNIKAIDVSMESINLLKDTFEKPVWKKISQIKQSKFNLNKLQKYIVSHQDIKNLSSKFTIKNGSFHLAKSKLQMPDSHVTIEGSYGIDGRLELKGDMVLTKSLLKQGIQNETLLNIITSPNDLLTLPYTITGVMPEPSLSLNEKAIRSHYTESLKELAKNETKKMVKKGVEETLEKTKEKVIQSIPKIEDKIKGLF